MPRPPLYLTKLSKWVEHMEMANYSPDTIQLYSVSAKYAWEYGASKGWPQDPKKIEIRHVREYAENLRQYSSQTQYSYSMAFLLFLRWNGNAQIENYRVRITPVRSRVDWLTVEDTVAVLMSAPNLWTRTMEIVFVYTGIRLSELVYLRMADMNQDYITVLGKRSKGRTIPVTKEFWQALAPYMEWRKTVDSPLFMCHPANAGNPPGPYTKGGIRSAIRNHCLQLDRHISAHTFRRSYGRHLYKAGMPLQEIQRLYGHVSLATTIRYLGINEEDLSTSVNKYQPKYT